MTFTFQKRVKLGLSNRQPVPRLTDPGFLSRGTAFSVSVYGLLAIPSLRAAHDDRSAEDDILRRRLWGLVRLRDRLPRRYLHRRHGLSSVAKPSALIPAKPWNMSPPP